MTDDLRARFDDAAERVQNLPQRPDNKNLLALYSLYKQATEGDVSGKRPGLPDFTGIAKYDAWAGLKGQDPASAMQAYIELVERLEASA